MSALQEYGASETPSHGVDDVYTPGGLPRKGEIVIGRFSADNMVSESARRRVASLASSSSSSSLVLLFLLGLDLSDNYFHRIVRKDKFFLASDRKQRKRVRCVSKLSVFSFFVSSLLFGMKSLEVHMGGCGTDCMYTADTHLSLHIGQLLIVVLEIADLIDVLIRSTGTDLLCEATSSRVCVCLLVVKCRAESRRHNFHSVETAVLAWTNGRCTYGLGPQDREHSLQRAS